MRISDWSSDVCSSDLNFLEKFPYYQKVLVKAGTYKGIDHDVTLFGNAGFIIANKDVPNEVVYEFTKLAYSKRAVDTVSMAFKRANMDSKNPFAGNIGPVHHGSARIVKDQGIELPVKLVPSLLADTVYFLSSLF